VPRAKYWAIHLSAKNSPEAKATGLIGRFGIGAFATLLKATTTGIADGKTTATTMHGTAGGTFALSQSLHRPSKETGQSSGGQRWCTESEGAVLGKFRGGPPGRKITSSTKRFFSMPTFARDSIGEHAASATCFRVLVSWAVLCHQRTKSRTDCFIACCIDCRLAQCLLLRLGHCGSYRSRAPLSVRKNTAATAATVALKTPCFDLIDVGLLILASNVTDLANHRQMNQS
jgi:hypothetical protein